MTIETTRSGEAVILKPVGRMDAASAPQFEAECKLHIDAGCRKLVADLSGLTYVSSLGLGSFVHAAKDLQGRGGDLVLSGMRGMVREVFSITKLLQVFKVYDTVESALASV